MLVEKWLQMYSKSLKGYNEMCQKQSLKKKDNVKNS